jgi:hypothetical protein
MKITTTIETNTEAEQLELMRALSTLTGYQADDTEPESEGAAAPKPKVKRRTKAEMKAAEEAKVAPEVAAYASEKDDGPTIDDVRKVLGANARMNLITESQKVLADHGVVKLPTLKKTQYASVIAALEALQS